MTSDFLIKNSPLRGNISPQTNQFNKVTTSRSDQADERELARQTSGASADRVTISSSSREAARAAEIRSSALDEIRSLRKEQLSVASEAQEISEGGQADELNAKIATLQTEIERVAEAATFNDESLFTEQDFSSGVSNGGYTIANFADVTEASRNLNLDVSDPVSAESAYNTILAELESAEVRSVQAEADVTETQNRIESTDSSALNRRVSSRDEIRDPNDAEEVAQDVVSQLQDRFGGASSQQPSVNELLATNKLSEDRVASLVDEES